MILHGSFLQRSTLGGRRQVQSRKIKPEPNITEATEKTGLLIRGLQSRLLEGVGEVHEATGDTATELENQLQA